MAMQLGQCTCRRLDSVSLAARVSALVACCLVAACDNRSAPVTANLPGTDSHVPVDDPRYSDFRYPTSPVVQCFTPERPNPLDYRPYPACVDLFRQLAACCENTLLVKTYVFEVLLDACWYQHTPSDDECSQHLDSAKLAQHCATLKHHPKCAGAVAEACGGGNHHFGNGKTCDYNGACHPGGTRFECSQVGDGYACKCFEGDQQTSECISPDVCELHGTLGVYLRMNECCGWSLSAPQEPLLSGGTP